MQQPDVDAIAAEWLARTDTDPEALRAFLAGAVPDVDGWAMRRLGSAGLEPQILAVSAGHLYRIASSVEDGRRAFGFDRLPLAGMSVALREWRDDDAVRRRWMLRTADDAFTVDTEQPDGETPPLERLMRLVLDRAR